MLSGADARAVLANRVEWSALSRLEGSDERAREKGPLWGSLPASEDLG